MLHTRVIEALGELEARFPVDAWTLGALRVWPLVRVALGGRLLATGRPPDRAVPAATALARLAHAARAGLADPRHTVLAVRPVDAVMLTRPANRERLGAAFVDRFADPLTDAVEARSGRALHVEHAGGLPYRVPRHRPSLLVEPVAMAARLAGAGRAVARASWPGGGPGAPRLRLPGYAAFARAVAGSGWGVAAPSRAWIAARAGAVDGLADLFARVLERAAPRVALVSCWYNPAGMALCLAARRAGVPAVDVQHGVTRRNPAYDGWTRLPAGGYALLPDRFWCWSEADTAPVAAWPATPAGAPPRAFAGGHPWLAFWQGDHPEAARARAAVEALAGPGPCVLVSLSWSSGLSDALREVVAAAPPGWTWWVRAHPLMAAERPALRAWAAGLGGRRVLVDGPSDLPLPLLLRAADAHLTHNSSVIQEAEAVGLPSVALDRRALDVYAAELAAGSCAFAEGPAAVLAAVEEAFAARRPAAPAEDRARLDAAVASLLGGPP